MIYYSSYIGKPTLNASNDTINSIINKTIPTITLPDGLTKIRKYIFKDCTLLTTITFLETIEEIGELAFFNTGLTTVNLPGKLKTLETKVFGNCSSLTSITLNSGLSEIKDYAFLNCTGLTTLTIPTTVQKIGLHAFAGCDNLTTINCNFIEGKIGGNPWGANKAQVTFITPDTP